MVVSFFHTKTLKIEKMPFYAFFFLDLYLCNSILNFDMLSLLNFRYWSPASTLLNMLLLEDLYFKISISATVASK